MKKLFSLILALLLSLQITGIEAYASDNTAEGFLNVYEEYKDFYINEYATAYHLFNGTIDELVRGILTAELSAAQLENLSDRIAAIRSKDMEFWGDRNTDGTSRTDVPQKRTQMYEAYHDGQFSLAIERAEELIDLVAERISHMEVILDELKIIKDEVDSYVPGDPETPDEPDEPDVPDEPDEPEEVNVGIKFDLQSPDNIYWTDFILTVTNNSDTTIDTWSLSFDVTGIEFIEALWVAGGWSRTIDSQSVRLENIPYTLNPGQSVVITGNGGVRTQTVLEFDNVTFNGQDTSVEYLVNGEKPIVGSTASHEVIFQEASTSTEYHVSFEVRIKNTGDKDIEGWDLTFDIAGIEVGAVWVTGGTGGLTPGATDGHITIAPETSASSPFILKPGEVVVVSGNGMPSGDGITLSNIKFDGNHSTIKLIDRFGDEKEF